MVIRKRAIPPQARGFPSLVNFRDQYIFVIGGCKYFDPRTQFTSVDLYAIEADVWLQAHESVRKADSPRESDSEDADSMAIPRLNTARMNHSSCVLGDAWIYTFGGVNGIDHLCSFERLNAKQMLEEQAAGALTMPK